MKRSVLGGALLLVLSSCSSLGIDPSTELTYTDPSTGEEVTTTLGDAMADQIEGTGSVVASTAGKAIGVATGNPVVGVSAAALLSDPAAKLHIVLEHLNFEQQPLLDSYAAGRISLPQLIDERVRLRQARRQAFTGVGGQKIDIGSSQAQCRCGLRFEGA